MNDIMQMRFGGRCDRHPLNIRPCEKCAAEAKAAPREMTPAEVRKMLDGMADPSQKALAVRLGISESYLSDVLTGRREPGEKLLEALGLERVVTYRTAGVTAAPAPSDAVWEALQRLIENGLAAGPASAEDARTIMRWRAQFVPAREPASGVDLPDGGKQ